MSLSIIIVSFNTRQLLEKCLKSVFQESSSIKSKIEAIVVDNASTDGSVEYLQSVTSDQLSVISKEKPTAGNRSPITIKLIENKENLGFAKAVNQGIREAQGKTIFLLNPDTQLKKNSLKNLVDFEEKVRPAIIGPKLLNPDGSPQPSVFFLPTIKRAILEFWLGKKGYFSKYLPKGKSPQEVEAILGGAMLISKAVIEKIGLFDERYFMYFEDLDYCRRARKAGFKVFYLPTAEIIHEHGASGRKLAAAQDQWRRLIPSSQIYYGFFKHYLITAIIWSGQKARRLFFKEST